MDSNSLHADAGSDGVDPVVVRLHGDFRPLACLTSDSLDLDDAVVSFRNLYFKQFREKFRVGTGDDHHGVRRALPDLLDDCAERFALPVPLFEYLLAFRKDEFIAVVIHEDLALAELVNLPDDDLAHRTI